MRPLSPDPFIKEVEAALLGAKDELHRFWATQLILLPADSDSRWQVGSTKIDHKCNDIINEALSFISSRVPVISEEDSKCCTENAPAFLIDPLDGTHNATGGYPAFTASVAYFDGAKYTFGWVYDISRNVLYSAYDGHGAYLQTDYVVKRLRKRRSSTSIAGMSVALMRPRIDGVLLESASMYSAWRKIRMSSCSSLDICLVASGVLDAFIDVGCPGNERSCDIAAASVIIQQAGGDLFLPSGARRIPSPPRAEATTDHGPVIACHDQLAVTSIRSFLKGSESDVFNEKYWSKAGVVS